MNTINHSASSLVAHHLSSVGAANSSPAAPKAAATVNTTASPDADDSVQLSPQAKAQVLLAGGIALASQNGSISSSQATGFTQQLQSIESTLKTDLANDGGTLSSTDAQTIQQDQKQLADSVYSAAHNGAAAPSSFNLSEGQARNLYEAGRISLNEQAGNITSDQASSLFGQLTSIDSQAQAGGTAQTITQLQNALSEQIYTEAHPQGASGSSGSTQG